MSNLVEFDNGETLSSVRGKINNNTVKLDPVIGFMDNMAYDQPQFNRISGGTENGPYVDGTDVKLDITVTGRNGLRWIANGEEVEISMPQTITVPQTETGTEPILQYVYARLDDNTGEYGIIVSTVKPKGSFLPICYVAIQTYVEVAATGPLVMQRTTEMITHDGQGSISRMREHTRLAEGNRHLSGAETTFKEDGGVISVNMLSTMFYQMNAQFCDEKDSATDGFLITNSEDEVAAVKNYTHHTDINDMKYLSDGTEISTNHYVAMYVYLAGNNNTENSKLIIRTPERSHATFSELENLISYSRAPRVDDLFRTVGFPVGILMLKYIGGGVFENAYTISTETVEWSWKNYALNIKSANYPNNYTNGINQTYQVTGPTNATKTQIIFSAFNTESRYDKLFYKAGTSYPSTVDPFWDDNLGSFSSQQFNNRVVSLRFITDVSVTRTGWWGSNMKCWVPTTILVDEQSIKMLDAKNKS